MELPPGVEIVTDPSAADWVVDGLAHPYSPSGGVHVGAVVPAGFEAYARIFHPLMPESGPVRWIHVVRSRGKVVHGEMQFHTLMDRDRHYSGFSSSDHPVAELPREDAHALVDILERFTTTAERAWFCIWNGFGGLPRWPDVVGAPRAEPDFRRYVLMRGPLAAMRRFELPVFQQPGSDLVDGKWVPREGGDFLGTRWQPPNIWWPEDRAWCVASEIDFFWTYVGGSKGCIDAICSSDALEALPTTVDARADHLGDRINRMD